MTFHARRLQKSLRERGIFSTFEVAIRQFFSRRWQHTRERVVQNARESGNDPVIQLESYRLHLHPSLCGISEVLLHYNMHEPESTLRYCRLIKPNETIVDIGSNIGYYALRSYASTRGTGRIICFEPLASNYEVLCRNIHENGLHDAFRVNQIAVSDKNEQVSFFESEVPNWGSLIYHERMKATRETQIDAVRLDDYLKENPDIVPSIIRMDIEGGEVAALDGAWATLQRLKPRLFVEFHPFIFGFHSLQSILSNLVILGYSDVIMINRIWDEPWIPSLLRKRYVMQTRLDDILNLIDRNLCPSNFAIITI